MAGPFQQGLGVAGNAAQNGGLAINGSLRGYLFIAIQFALTFVGVVALAALIYGGFSYITAFGDEKKAAKGKAVVLYAVIGLIIVGFSVLLVNTVIFGLLGQLH